MDEKRLYPRKPFYATVFIKRPDRETLLSGNALDLSPCGIGLYSETPLWPGQHCRIEIELPTKSRQILKKMSIGCESLSCTYSEDRHVYRIGFLFVDIAVEDAGLIDAYIQRTPDKD